MRLLLVLLLSMSLLACSGSSSSSGTSQAQQAQEPKLVAEIDSTATGADGASLSTRATVTYTNPSSQQVSASTKGDGQSEL